MVRNSADMVMIVVVVGVGNVVGVFVIGPTAKLLSFIDLSAGVGCDVSMLCIRVWISSNDDVTSIRMGIN